MNSTLTGPTKTQASLEKKWGKLGGYNYVEVKDIETPLDADQLPKIHRGFAVGSITIPNGVVEVTKSVIQETPGAIGDLVFTEIGGRVHEKPVEQTPEEQEEAVLKQAEEAMRMKAFNEPIKKRPIIVERKVALIGDQSMTNDEIVELAGLSSSFNAINEDGTVDAYTQSVVEDAENFLKKKKEERENTLAIATGKVAGLSLDLNKAPEGGLLSAVTSAG